MSPLSSLAIWCLAVFLLVIMLGVVYPVWVNASDIYEERKSEYEDQQRGWPTENYVLEKPIWKEAFRDALAFQIKYMLSFGKVNTSNYDFDARYKKQS